MPDFDFPPLCPAAVGNAAEVSPGSANDLPELLQGRDIQALFGRSARTIRRWIRAGHLAPVRVGGAVFYRPDDVRRLIEGDLTRAVLASSRRGWTGQS